MEKFRSVEDLIKYQEISTFSKRHLKIKKRGLYHENSSKINLQHRPLLLKTRLI